MQLHKLASHKGLLRFVKRRRRLFGPSHAFVRVCRQDQVKSKEEKELWSTPVLKNPERLIKISRERNGDKSSVKMSLTDN